MLSKLEYIKSLGSDAIWFSPLYVSPQADYGYDIADYKNINPEYGTLDDFKAVLEKAHALGMRVIMDLVINHTSDQHEWFKKSCARVEPYTDFYIWRKGKGKDGKKVPNNWMSTFPGSASGVQRAKGRVLSAPIRKGATRPQSRQSQGQRSGEGRDEILVGYGRRRFQRGRHHANQQG